MNHAIIERSGRVLLILTFFIISIGGLVQIVPLFTNESTVEVVDTVRPYTPLELVGQDIYRREGCMACHSQMIRPFRDEVDRYGHYSIAAESQYDHPFYWGTKRTGPDLARVGGKYSNEWHVAHLRDPRSVAPESVMPSYAFLSDRVLDPSTIRRKLRTLAMVNVPYQGAHIAEAPADLIAQATPDADVDGLLQRYPNARTGDFDGRPDRVTEMDAVVAYLQSLGTHVDFSTLDAAGQGPRAASQNGKRGAQ